MPTTLFWWFIAIGRGCFWISVGTMHLSSASARVIGSARPKSCKGLKQPSFYFFSSRRCQMLCTPFGKWRRCRPRVARTVDRKRAENRAENLASARNFVHAAQVTSSPNAPVIWPTIARIARPRRERGCQPTKKVTLFGPVRVPARLRKLLDGLVETVRRIRKANRT